MLLLNLQNQLPNMLFAHTPRYLAPPWPSAPFAWSLEDDGCEAWVNAFLTTLSLIERSAPGLGSAHVHAAQITAPRRICRSFRGNFDFIGILSSSVRAA